jgi:hypothetical protein
LCQDPLRKSQTLFWYLGPRIRNSTGRTEYTRGRRRVESQRPRVLCVFSFLCWADLLAAPPPQRFAVSLPLRRPCFPISLFPLALGSLPISLISYFPSHPLLPFTAKDLDHFRFTQSGLACSLFACSLSLFLFLTLALKGQKKGSVSAVLRRYYKTVISPASLYSLPSLNLHPSLKNIFDRGIKSLGNNIIASAASGHRQFFLVRPVLLWLTTFCNCLTDSYSSSGELACRC